MSAHKISREIKEPVPIPMANPPSDDEAPPPSKSPFYQTISKSLVISIALLLLQLTPKAESASAKDSKNEGQVTFENLPFHQYFPTNYRFLDRYNEFDSGSSIFDQDTFRLSIAIDDDTGLSSPSLHTLEPRVHLKVSGESGMIPPSPNKVTTTDSRASRDKTKKPKPANVQFHRELSPTRDEPEDDEDEDEPSESYHRRVPYIESYREKYVRPDPALFEVTTLKPRTTLPASKSAKQEWSDIIAQVTTPSSFNEINSSASEHRLADYHLRANLLSYFSNKYHAYSEEDLDNFADLDDEHSKYFVKTRPRSVTTTGRKIYSNFYYEPPSFSTKSVPTPVKTNKQSLVFVPAKEFHSRQHDFPYHDHDAPVVPTTAPTFTLTRDHKNNQLSRAQVKDNVVPTPSPKITQSVEGNLKHSASNNPYLLKSSSETLDVSTSQSILSKVTLNNPHLFRHPQFLIINSDYTKTTGVTPRSRNDDDITLTSIKLASTELDSQSNESISSARLEQTTTESPATEVRTTTVSTTPVPISTTTDATSIPGIPGVDYPTLGEIPQTSFDCKNQRYKGFFADIETKCQAWHYCDFTDSHSTFLCPNGTLFSQVLLTCDWWFNVDCDQARQLYVLNERLYRYIKPPKPSFPEDFTGEHVDKWLLQQYTSGHLPRIRKKSKAKLVLPPPTTTEASTTQKEH